MQECRDETDVYNYQRIQPSNNKFINAILGVGGGGGVRLTCPECIVNLSDRSTFTSNKALLPYDVIDFAMLSALYSTRRVSFDLPR